MDNFYDIGNALKEFIAQSFVGNVLYDSADNSFEYALNQVGNKNFRFPMIAIYHQNDIDIDMPRNSFPTYTRGRLYEQAVKVRDENMKQSGETNEKISKSVQNLYITMKYIIDVYGTDRISTEKVTQELLFWLFYNQQVTFKYNGQPLNFTLDISPNIIDNTDLASYHSNNKLYRYSISVSIHSALFRSIDYFTVLKPEIEITVGTENNK